MQTREVKLVMLGIGGVGKSTIVIRKIQNIFVEEYDPFIEDTYRKVIDLNGEQVMLDILDTAGQEEYSMLRDRWTRQCDGFIIMYSITDINSFLEIERFCDQIYRIRDMDDDDYVPIIIAGNKIDLEEERQVTTEEGEHFADQRGIDFIECSAKENINIDELFDTIVLNVINGNSSFPLGIDSVPERTRGCILC